MNVAQNVCMLCALLIPKMPDSVWLFFLISYIPNVFVPYQVLKMDLDKCNYGNWFFFFSQIFNASC